MAIATSITSTIALSGGARLPFVGLGTYLQSNDEARVSVRQALSHGYCHIDTAEIYGNHAGIAQGIADWGGAREELFITDKLDAGGLFGSPEATYDGTLATLRKHLKLLNTSYVDLYLIHHPGAKTERLRQWQALIDAQQNGLVKAIGVSNYSKKHLEEIKSAGMKLPEVNQIEIHPLCTQAELVQYCRDNGIVPVAYSSLAPCTNWRAGQNSAKTDAHCKQVELLDALTAKYAVSQAQILLKWALQKGYPILPKSTKPERVIENANLFGFELEAEDVQQLDSLDENAALAWPSAIGNPLNWE